MIEPPDPARARTTTVSGSTAMTNIVSGAGGVDGEGVAHLMRVRGVFFGLFRGSEGVRSPPLIRVIPRARAKRLSVG